MNLHDTHRIAVIYTVWHFCCCILLELTVGLIIKIKLNHTLTRFSVLKKKTLLQFFYLGRISDLIVVWPIRLHRIRRFGHRSQPMRPAAELVFGRTELPDVPAASVPAPIFRPQTFEAGTDPRGIPAPILSAPVN